MRARGTLLALALLAGAADAKEPPKPPTEAEVADALTVCAFAAAQGDKAGKAIRKAGFHPDDAAGSDGEIGYSAGLLRMAIWEEPGSCHLEVPTVPTSRMNAMLAARTKEPVGREEGEEISCPLYHLSNSIDAAVLGLPVDGTCDSADGSFVRFYPR